MRLHKDIAALRDQLVEAGFVLIRQKRHPLYRHSEYTDLTIGLTGSKPLSYTISHTKTKVKRLLEEVARRKAEKLQNEKEKRDSMTKNERKEGAAFSERFRQGLKEKGFSYRSINALYKITQNCDKTVSRTVLTRFIHKGTEINLGHGKTRSAVKRAADAFGLDIHWLLTGQRTVVDDTVSTEAPKEPKEAPAKETSIKPSMKAVIEELQSARRSLDKAIEMLTASQDADIKEAIQERLLELAASL